MDASISGLANLITLPEIFSGKLFRIPDYQRGYTWGSEQVLALLDDIEQLFTYQHSHYTGTLVIVKKEHPTPSEIEHGTTFDIIDGQQRLTTFSILLNCLIAGISDTAEQKKLNELYFYRGADGNRTRVLMLNKNVDAFFRSCVLEKKHQKKSDIQLVSQRYIINAYTKINDWLRKQYEKGHSANSILELVTTKFGFIVYRPLEENEAGMMFEVINNRGKPLSELDKVKNYLVYYAIKLKKRDLQDKVNQHWGGILKNLAKAHNLNSPDEQALLRAAVVSYFGFSKDQSSSIYKNLKEKFPLDGPDGDWSKLIDFVEYLSKASGYYECVLNDNSALRHDLNNNEIVEQVERIRSQKAHASIMPLFFAVMERRDEIGDDQVVDLLRMMEILSFRVYMTRNGAKRTDSGQAELYRLSHYLLNIESGESWAKEYSDVNALRQENLVVIAILKELYGLINYYCNDEKLEEGLSLRASDTDDFYDWGALRYFLMSYEQKISPKRTIKVDKILKGRTKGKSNDNISVEHIWATENKLKGSATRQKEDLRSKRRLGNYALLELGINSQAGREGLGEKVRIYDGENSSEDKSNLAQVHRIVADYESSLKEEDPDNNKKKVDNFYRKVNLKTIKKIEQRYIDFAKERWSIEWAESYWNPTEPTMS